MARRWRNLHASLLELEIPRKTISHGAQRERKRKRVILIRELVKLCVSPFDLDSRFLPFTFPRIRLLPENINVRFPGVFAAKRRNGEWFSAHVRAERSRAKAKRRINVFGTELIPTGDALSISSEPGTTTTRRRGSEFTRPLCVEKRDLEFLSTRSLRCANYLRSCCWIFRECKLEIYIFDVIL